MLGHKRILSGVLALAVLAAAAPATKSVVGVWTGRFIGYGTIAPKHATPEQKRDFRQRVAAVSKLRVHFKLKPDGTYTTASRGPLSGRVLQYAGTWRLSGRTLALTATKLNGKPTKGNATKARYYRLSEDGRTLTSTRRESAGGRLVLRRD